MGRLYFTTRDGGDGSCSIEFVESREVINFLEENDPETYGAGEGGFWIDFPGEITELRSCWGEIKPTTMADAKEELGLDDED